MKTLVFDMDGTIADLYNVVNWLENLRKESTSPYAEALPMFNQNFSQLIAYVRANYNYNIVVCSWCSKGATKEYRKEIRKTKRQWLIDNGFEYDHLHVIPYGTPKHRVCRKYGASVLFDDSLSVRNDWNLGEAVDPDAVDMYKFIANLLK